MDIDPQRTIPSLGEAAKGYWLANVHGTLEDPGDSDSQQKDWVYLWNPQGDIVWMTVDTGQTHAALAHEANWTIERLFVIMSKRGIAPKLYWLQTVVFRIAMRVICRPAVHSCQLDQRFALSLKLHIRINC